LVVKIVRCDGTKCLSSDENWELGIEH
jgi:hypothetical protein